MAKTQLKISIDQIIALRKATIASSHSLVVAGTVTEIAMNGQTAPTICGLGKILKLPLSSVSRCAYELEQAGLVEYTAHDTDRRKKLVTPTPRLRKLMGVP